MNVVDVMLEGERAPQQIANTLRRLNREKSTDVIVLTRGGGRARDLSVFDDYLIAEAIGRSEIPVVTGIGHQHNETLADKMADAAQITPTAAGIFLARLLLLEEEAAAQTQPRRISTLIIAAVVIGAGVILAIIAYLLSNP